MLDVGSEVALQDASDASQVVIVSGRVLLTIRTNESFISLARVLRTSICLSNKNIIERYSFAFGRMKLNVNMLF